jgi:DNA-binding NarL/FixJ family response regulator
MLIEDNQNYRKSILCALDEKPDMEVIGQYSTAEAALQTLQKMNQQNLPDIILLDLNLLGMSGLDAIPLIKQQAPEIKMIILSQSDREPDILSAISRGAAGYLLKSSSIDAIIDGIALVHAGGATLDAHLAKFILNTLSNRMPKATSKTRLSKRETDVLILITEGLGQKQIASRLDISTHTVNEHIQKIYSKLDAQNAAAAVSQAYRLGILPSGK